MSIGASMPAAAIAKLALPRAMLSEGDIADSFWRSLRYFSVYRMVVAAVFLVAFLSTGGTANLASQSRELFLWTDTCYLVLSFAFLFALQRFDHAFNRQVSIQVACDIVALTLLMYASGGAKSGIAFMLVVVVAGAGLVGQGRLTLFYAALATVAVLIEQAFRMLHFGADAEDFFRTGLISIGFFATAVIAQLLARRVVANEALARQRGIELAEQVRINQQVIEDMDDGVLVVDAAGRVRLHNPQAQALLAVERPAGVDLAVYCPVLADHLRQRAPVAETSNILRMPDNGKSLLVRLLPPIAGGDTLIYIQDIGRLQAQAQQIKLAALGRLTANIAHEIRNPLAAISHAAELLVDEQRAETRARLVRIIGDNTQRLNRLVGDVLELGRRDRAQPEAIDLAAFLRQFVDEYGFPDPALRSRVRVAVDATVTVSFDRAHLYRVLENLITNALRYASAAEGAVVVAVDALSPNRIELHIIDDGPGIAELDRAKVFEPFFTTRGSGTGLGLYIARELCDANGAQLELLDDPAGAHFRIVAKGGACPPNMIVEV
jgi:two-component system sensor histidine kinase PilS (NtrC family)